MKRTAVSLLVMLTATGLAWADRSVDETRPLAADGRVEISNVAGEVTVEGWSGAEVAITGTLESGVEDLEIRSSGSRLRIEVDLNHKARTNGSAYLTIKMPATADLEVGTVSADISVDGVNGEVDLESVSGSIEVSEGPTLLEAASVSGTVRVASTSGRSELESVSGDIAVRYATGRLEVGVVSGDIEIDDGVLDSLTAESVSGRIVCRATPSDRGRFDLETMSGTIELVLADDVDADFSIETYSGSIRNDFGPEPRRSDEYGPGRELRFTSGSGGARVSVESFSGSVKLRAK
jgi:DUF4097 and DUF4098 domain-containing protein YvlB